MDGAPRYRLARSIGEGATAEVFEAFASSEHDFERRFALKHLHADLANDPSVVRSFIDEARIASRLQHMNLVSVFDVGTLEERPFIVLEFVDGPSLGEVLAEGPLPAPLALFIAWEVANGLDHVHSAGVVHRDLTPSNVLLSWSGEVKLTDFGIAIAAEKRERTAAGVVKGKLQYIAPEQFKRELVDARTDVFSLGLMLLQMASGTNPLEDETIRRQVIAGGEVPIPNAVSREIKKIVRDATRPNRDDRPTAKQVAAECSRALAGSRQSDPRRALVDHLAGLRPETVKRRNALSVLLQVEIVLDASSVDRHFTEVTQREDETTPGTFDVTKPLPDPYVRHEQIGGGAFSEVFRATERATGREVALKLLRAGLHDAIHARTRFMREAEALRSIRHPNLVELLGAGTTQDGHPWLAFELLQGRTLGVALKEGPFPLQRALAIARQLAAGLAAIHAGGVVHRDLKPTNVMLVNDPAGGERVKILDFGIARILDPERGLTRLTKPGDLLGTVRWMAPEQAVGAHAADHRTDLYALGLILMRMLDGPKAFEGDAREILLARVVSDLGPLPNAGRFEPVLRSLLERDPKKRPRSAASVSAWFDELTNERADRAPWGLATLVLLALIVLMGAILWKGSERKRPPQVVIAPQIESAPSVDPGVDPSPDPPPEDVVPQTPPPPKKARAPQRPPPRSLRSELSSAVEARGLSPSTLAAHPRTRGPYSVWKRAQQEQDAETFERAENDLQAALREVTNDALLDAQLRNLRRRIADQQDDLSAAELERAERAYLELRSRVQAGLTPQQTRELLRGIDELEAALR